MQGDMKNPQNPELPYVFKHRILKIKVREGCVGVADFLVSESFVLAAVHVGQVTMFL